jgi:hypothetical protein
VGTEFWYLTRNALGARARALLRFSVAAVVLRSLVPTSLIASTRRAR